MLTLEMFVFIQLIAHMLYEQVNVPALQWVYRGVVCFSLCD